MISTVTTRPNTSAPLISVAFEFHRAHMSTQSKLGKDAPSEVCSAHKRGRTPIQRSHACSYAVDSLDQCEQDQEHHDSEQYGHNVHDRTIGRQPSRPRDDQSGAYNDFVTTLTRELPPKNAPATPTTAVSGADGKQMEQPAFGLPTHNPTRHYPANRYPTPGSVTMYLGTGLSGSIFARSRAM